MTTTAAPAPRQLRDYQVAAANAVEQDWASGKNRVGVVLPTGSGKSSVIGEIARRAYRRGQRVVAMAHRGELLDQMKRDLLAVDPTIPESDIGIVRAEEDDHHCPIVFAMLQTLATARRREALGKREVILWDEVHHAGAEGFHTTFSELGGYDDALMCGLTATMYRNERGVIGLGDVIQKISYEKDIRWAIKKGFLVQPRGLTVRIKGLDALNDVRSVAGDFHQGELAEVMEACTQYVVDAIKLHAADRRPIIFAASVDAAHHIADALTAADFPALAVTGAMSYVDRLPVYEQFRDGTARALVTVQVLTEGADFPMCDTVVLARPTRSRNLYSQMVGRALRLYPDKDDALVLDLAGSTRAMKLVSLTALDTGAETREVDEFGEDIELDELDDLMGDGGGEPAVKEVRQGPVDMVSIDLLANSDLVWMETTGGIPFLPLMEDNQVVFIMPEGYRVPPKGQADTVRWAIGQMGTRSRRGGWVTASGRYPIHTDDPDFTDLATALENAEVWIVESDQQLPERKASWRRNQKPSEAQLKFARTLGIVIDEDMTKARLSDEISVRVTSRALDKFLEA
ncbi:DNA helicase [Mycobacterium phage ChrisnMich]|uniref:DNA helicase n=1 Tax=Mycobacterium phage ChrisnMich TaxID=1034130 RepID=G1BLA4_9CAUD|nr:DNA helicase [Mycobacterium phage ChrisnMich]AEJ94629.1 DNA helicase [Mycobacterium phage ChrisnMich]